MELNDMMMQPKPTETSNQNTPNCPLCNDTGWICEEDENGYVFSKECSCGLLKKQRMESRIRFANLPKSFKDCKLNQLKTSVYQTEQARTVFINAAKAVKYWLEHVDEMLEKGNGLYLYSGTKGSGKTTVVAGIANALINEHGMSVKFATSLQILDEIKRTYNKTEQVEYAENQLLDALVTVDILIVDDFGTETVRDWANEKFYGIINGRYVGNKVTIFTSNTNLNDLKYDERITNRIKEKCYLIPFPEESVRETIAKQLSEELKGAIK